MSDLESFTMTDAEQFFRTYYAPSNLITVLVGDVRAETAIPVLETTSAASRPGPVRRRCARSSRPRAPRRS